MTRRICLVYCVVLAISLIASVACAADKVVIIPMKSTPAAQEKELYIPAPALRPVTALLGGSYYADGAMIKPNGGGYWNATFLLPAGTTIMSFELFSNNGVYNTWGSSIILHLFNLANGAGIQIATMISSVALEGVHSVKTDTINTPRQEITSFRCRCISAIPTAGSWA